MIYNKDSFCKGLAVGIQLHGWASAKDGKIGPAPGDVPEVVTDGLIRYYDALRNDGETYSRNITTWKDLSNHNDGSIFSASWASDYPALTFTGDLLERVESEFVVNQNILPITIEACFRYKVDDFIYPPFWLNVFGCSSWDFSEGIPTGGGIEVNLDNGSKGIATGWALQYDGTKMWRNSTTATKKDFVYCVAFTIDEDMRMQRYIQGRKVWDFTFSDAILLSSGSQMYIGANQKESGRVFYGDVFSARIYNKVLDNSEIWNNTIHDLMIYSAGLNPIQLNL